MKAYCLQLDPVWEKKRPNHEKVLALLERTRPEKGSLVVLPEMFATGFSMNVADITDSDGASQGFLARIASEFKVYVVGGLVTTAKSGRGLNQAVVFDSSGVELTRYSKIHTFTPGGESDHYEMGTELRGFDWSGFKVCPLICYDLRFPELFRRALMQGTTLFTVIASWPEVRVAHWVTLLRARAIENQAYVLGVNRCGSDPFLSYPGRSLVIDPGGDVLVEAGAEEGMISSEIDLEFLLDYRQRLPFVVDFECHD